MLQELQSKSSTVLSVGQFASQMGKIASGLKTYIRTQMNCAIGLFHHLCIVDRVLCIFKKALDCVRIPKVTSKIIL